METTFTDAEQSILKHFYDKLAPHFGITAIWPTLCLRSKVGDITLRLEQVSTPYRQNICFMCEQPEEGLQPATVIVTHADGHKTEWKVKTCYECRCPQ